MSSSQRMTRSASRSRLSMGLSSGLREPYRSRSPASRKSSSKKKRTSSAKKTAESPVSTPRRSSSSRKKSSSSRRSSPANSPARRPARRSLSRTFSDATAEVERPVRTRSSPRLAEAARRAADVDTSSIQYADSSLVGSVDESFVREPDVRREQTAQPLVALLPHALLYLAIVGKLHLWLLYSFAKPSFREYILSSMSAATRCVGLEWGWTKPYLEWASKYHLPFFLALPVSIAATLLLRQGVRTVFGRRDRAFAMNLARVLSAALQLFTVYAYTKGDQQNSAEGLNALVVLQFAFMAQELLLNYRRFTGARLIYSAIYLLVTGVYSHLAFTFQPTATTSPQAPVRIVAINYALLIVNTSHNLQSLSTLCSRLMLSDVLSTIFGALAQVVQFGLGPIMAVSLYMRHAMLFPFKSDRKQPAFLDSTLAALIMGALIFLQVVDATVQQSSTPTSSTSRASKRKGM